MDFSFVVCCLVCCSTFEIEFWVCIMMICTLFTLIVWFCLITWFTCFYGICVLTWVVCFVVDLFVVLCLFCLLGLLCLRLLSLVLIWFYVDYLLLLGIVVSLAGCLVDFTGLCFVVGLGYPFCCCMF